MATIGFDKPFYAKITEGANGVETYGTPTRLAKAISANINIEYAEADLAADDGIAESAKEFKSGTLSLNVDDIGSSVAADLIGARVDKNGVIAYSAEDISDYVAVGFRARKANGKYRYFWLYRVKFGVPATSLATKGDNITFNTPTIEGKIMRRNKEDAQNQHLWKIEVTEGDTGVSDTVINNWFNEVYEPDFTE